MPKRMESVSVVGWKVLGAWKINRGQYFIQVWVREPKHVP